MTYRNLVFKGGGAKIFYSVGAVEALEERGVMEGIERTAGVSAGAVSALLVALNMNANEIKEFFLDFSLNDEAFGGDPLEETHRFFEEYGRYTGKYLLGQLHTLLEEKCGNPDITFGELHDLGFKDVYLFASDVKSGSLVQFSWEETPDFSVADAVRASACYPFYFVPSYGPKGEVLVDGGLLDNYPLWLFDEPRFLSDPNAEYNEETLGICLGSCGKGQSLWSNDDLKFVMQLFDDMHSEVILKKMLSLDFSQVFDNPDLDYDFLGYLIRVFDVGKTASTEYHHPNLAGEICITTDFINSTGRRQSTFDLDIDRTIRQELMDHGKAAAEQFFQEECVSGYGEYCFIQDSPVFDIGISNMASDFITVVA